MKKLLFTLFFCSLSLSLSAQSWDELTEKGVQAYQAGSYKEATSYFEKALKQAEKEFGKNHENYATSCLILASLYERQGRYAEAEPLYKEAKEIYAKVLGKEHPYYATSCNNLASLYESQGRYAEAEPLHKEALAIRAKVLGKEHPDYASSCNNLAELYRIQGRYAEAEPLYKEAKEIYAKVLGKEHPDYALSCNNLAGLYDNQGRYAEAEPLYKEAKEIYAKVLGKEHPSYATSCNNLASFYERQGRYAEAEPLYKEALAIKAKVLGKEHPDYALSCNNLAGLYYNQGRYAEAEPLYKEALAIRAKVLGKEHPDYALSCNNLAGLYYNQGRYAEAEPLLKEAKEIFGKVLGKEHPHYAQSCNNLAGLYDEQGRYAEAEPLYKEALAIEAKVLGKEHPDYALSCNNLAGLYKDQGRYAEAEPLLKEAKEIFGKVLGKEHPSYATSCNNLALLYKDQGRYAEAEPLYKEALAIRAKVLGKEHPYYATSCNNLALLYERQGLYAEAEPLYKEASQTLIANIRRNFVGLSEKEKEQYLATFKNHFEFYFSFALKAQKPELYGWLLENTMITKGLLFFSTSQLRRTLENSKDQQLQTLYQNWLEKRKTISKAYELTIAQRKEKNINLEALEKEANEIEKQLSVALSAKGIQAELTPTPRSWKELQQKLQANEALVEMVRVEYHDKKWTDSILYLAMVVKKNSLNPEIVVFANGKEMETGDIAFYRNCIKLKKSDRESYKAFFSLLEPKLAGIKKLYFSGDGVYHQINLETLYDAVSQRYLGDKWEVQLISTARDYLRLGKKALTQTAKAYQIYLMGYPNYSGAKPSEEKKNEERAFDMVATRIDKRQRFFDALTGAVASLPGTKKEVEGISRIAQKAGWRAVLKLADEASEENIKQIHGVRVLHVATHGFFIEAKEAKNEKEQKFDNPLLRSGLLLAGAELTLKGRSTGSKENGILTAKEAMDIDLGGTDLVVLSACETGLGEIKAGEGVFGLQRALQEAGAGSVVMSLWRVDDEATQELMNLFYENYLIKKQDKRVAFRQAQEALRAKYKEPYYWGAFVMVGE